MRILLVEDYESLRLAVSQALTMQGYAVDIASDGEEGRWYLSGNQYDLIILDIMLPKINGLSLLKDMRQTGNRVHVLVITARDAVEDRIEGLDLGADDYLVKPFIMAEMLARVRTLLRRGYEVKSAIIAIADVEINTSLRSVKRAGIPIDVTPREYSLLEYLALRYGSLVTRDEIREHLYDFASDNSSNVINVYIGYLRKKLGDVPVQLVHTRRGMGYVLSDKESP